MRPRENRIRRLVSIGLVLALTTAVAALAPTNPAGAAEQVNGSGSTWSAIAVLQWQADVARQGLSINFTANGSSTGRKFYIQNQSDFAVSEIPFQPESRDRDGNILYNEIQQASARPYVYLPIVAGGTSFMYNLVVGGRRITDLRLSGETITKIFTGVITNWNDPAITRDDGRRFPSKAMKPVLRSDGSGTSAQFSVYMATVYNSLWRAFCARTGLTPCGQTSLYPYFPGSQAQNGSEGVASAVAAGYNDGAITYVEYGYAKQKGFPVVSVRNQAGYFVQPTAGNVAVALTRARLNPDRTQILNDVYSNPDRRTYPVSSYSYMIVPTSEAGRFTAAKGQVLGRFILYFLCTGQQKAEQLGYSPLPANLVQFGFDSVRRIPGAPAPPALTQCANPTITGAFSPERAPQPPADAAPDALRAGGDNEGGRVGGADVTTPDDAASGGDTGGTVPGETDEVAGDADLTGTDGSGTEASAEEAAAAAANLTPASITAGPDSVPVVLYALVVVLVLLCVFGPPVASNGLRRLGGGRTSKRGLHLH